MGRWRRKAAEWTDGNGLLLLKGPRLSENRAIERSSKFVRIKLTGTGKRKTEAINSLPEFKGRCRHFGSVETFYILMGPSHFLIQERENSMTANSLYLNYDAFTVPKSLC